MEAKPCGGYFWGVLFFTGAFCSARCFLKATACCVWNVLKSLYLVQTSNRFRAFAARVL
jgi:hypothetical protein